MSAYPYYIPYAPLEDDDLDNALQGMIVGITGLDQTLVRPRWQTNPPKQPEPTDDWCAIGVTSSQADTFPVVQHLFGDDITAPAGDLLIRHETLDVMVSFYGPHAKTNLGILRDGLGILQNLDSVKAAGLYFIEMDAAHIAPDFINQQWIRRWDTALVFRRSVARVYGVNNILSAEIDLLDDSGHVDRVIDVPPSGR
jgi:hypothetical protein